MRQQERGKFGEHEWGVRVARGAAECNSSLKLFLRTSSGRSSISPVNVFCFVFFLKKREKEYVAFFQVR